MWKNKIRDSRFGVFLGGFVSEGNLVENGSLKITNQDLNFIDCIVKAASTLFGKNIATDKPPTPEHVSKSEDFAYHKYMSQKFGRFLIKKVGIKPGKRILNDDTLPGSIIKWFKSGKNLENFKEWMKGYIQARFSGDGWVHLTKKWVGLTKVKAIHISDPILQTELSNLYLKGKQIKDYPKDFVGKLKIEARKVNNLPKELIELRDILKKIFFIDSRVYSVGIRTIYYDKKRDILIVSGSYHLIISRKDNVKKFKDCINFLEIDKRNRERLDLI